MQINGAEKQVCRELHIAYRYGDHYDSVRRTGDNSENPTQLRIEVCNIHHQHLGKYPQFWMWWCVSDVVCFAIAFLRICRTHKASSVSLGMVRGTDRKTHLPQPQRRTTWSWAPSRTEASRVRSSTGFISCREQLNFRLHNHQAFKSIFSAKCSISPINMSGYRPFQTWQHELQYINGTLCIFCCNLIRFSHTTIVLLCFWYWDKTTEI